MLLPVAASQGTASVDADTAQKRPTRYVALARQLSKFVAHTVD